MAQDFPHGGYFLPVPSGFPNCPDAMFDPGVQCNFSEIGCAFSMSVNYTYYTEGRAGHYLNCGDVYYIGAIQATATASLVRVPYSPEYLKDYNPCEFGNEYASLYCRDIGETPAYWESKGEQDNPGCFTIARTCCPGFAYMGGKHRISNPGIGSRTHGFLFYGKREFYVGSSAPGVTYIRDPGDESQCPDEWRDWLEEQRNPGSHPDAEMPVPVMYGCKDTPALGEDSQKGGIATLEFWLEIQAYNAPDNESGKWRARWSARVLMPFPCIITSLKSILADALCTADSGWFFVNMDTLQEISGGATVETDLEDPFSYSAGSSFNASSRFVFGDGAKLVQETVDTGVGPSEGWGGGLITSGLTTGGLTTGGLETSGGLGSSSLESSGGLNTGGLNTGGLRGTGGLGTTGGFADTGGLGDSGGLGNSGGFNVVGLHSGGL